VRRWRELVADRNKWKKKTKTKKNKKKKKNGGLYTAIH